MKLKQLQYGIKMYVLGIESSCDETAVAIVSPKGVVSHSIFSQIKIHSQYGGVIPEVAAREHLGIIDTLIKQALSDAKLAFTDISAFAATLGPGLAGGLIIGALSAKTLAFVYNKPFLAVNHLQAHALAPSLEHKISNPHLILLLSGGHSQFIVSKGLQQYKVLGSTIDDSVGEAFDKSARLLGLQYPGGQEIEKLAKLGNPHKFIFPKPLENKKNCDFSLSGLKTMFRETVTKVELTEQNKQDLSASLQYTILQIILNRLNNAIKMFEEHEGTLKQLVLSGGVSANKYLKENISNFLKDKRIELITPSQDLCTDNGVMIAWAGLQKLENNLVDDLSTPIKVRWSLEDLQKH